MTIALLVFLVVASLTAWSLVRVSSLKSVPVELVNESTSISSEITTVLRFESRLTAAQVTRRLRKRGWGIGRAAVRDLLNEVAYATRTKRGRLLYS